MNCTPQALECLPIYDLNDLQFQLITDFAHVGETSITNIVAVPCTGGCDEYTDEDILDMAFGAQLTAFGSGDDGGNLQIALLSLGDIQVGDLVILSSACTIGGMHNYAGTHEVLAVDSGLGTITLDTPFEGNIQNDCDSGDITDVFVLASSHAPHLVSAEYIEIDSDSVFPGRNFVWNLSLGVVASDVLNYADGECFQFCIYKATQLGPDAGVECLGTTNCFRKTSDLCFTSKLTYGSNEDGFGFYTDGTDPFELSIRLPFFLKNAQYPGEEKGYQRSDGTFIKLAERINKTWDLETDLMPDVWHERLRIALSCDNIELSNEAAALTDEPVYRSEGYEIDEPVEQFPTFPFRKASTKLFKRRLVASVNSNCV